MRTVAYCTQTAKKVVARATRTEPLTSPPLTAGTFFPELLDGADLLYFRLHPGSEDNAGVWSGEAENGLRPFALRLETIGKLKLNYTIVVIANCYGDRSPFVQAFYDAGARVVIAIPGQNYATKKRVTGTDLLVSVLISALRLGFSLNTSLKLARARLTLGKRHKVLTQTGKVIYPNADTLEFQIINRRFRDE